MLRLSIHRVVSTRDSDFFAGGDIALLNHVMHKLAEEIIRLREEAGKPKGYFVIDVSFELPLEEC